MYKEGDVRILKELIPEMQKKALTLAELFKLINTKYHKEKHFYSWISYVCPLQATIKMCGEQK